MGLGISKASICKILEYNSKDRIQFFLKNGILILMALFIFLNPFPHTTAIKEISFYCSLLLLLILIISKKIDFTFKSPLTVPFMLFTAWVVIGLFFALDKNNSSHDFLVHLVKYLIFYYLMINTFRTKNCLTSLSWVIVISATVFSIGGMYYFYVMGGHSLSAKLTLGLPEMPVNLIGVTTVTAMIFALHNFLSSGTIYYRAISIICAIPLFSATILTQCRGTVIAMILASIILLLKNKKILIILLGVTLIITANTPMKNRFLNGNLFYGLRMDINYTTLEILKDFPIIGIGFGMETYRNEKIIDLDVFNKRVPPKYRQKYIHNDPHNMLLSIAVRTGFVGLLLFLYILFSSFKMCWTTIRHGENEFIRNWGLCITSVFVVVLVIGLFEPIFSHVPEVIFYTILGMMTILWQTNHQ